MIVVVCAWPAAVGVRVVVVVVGGVAPMGLLETAPTSTPRSLGRIMNWISKIMALNGLEREPPKIRMK